jgi:hypothetical protein
MYCGPLNLTIFYGSAKTIGVEENNDHQTGSLLAGNEWVGEKSLPKGITSDTVQTEA